MSRTHHAPSQLQLDACRAIAVVGRVRVDIDDPTVAALLRAELVELTEDERYLKLSERGLDLIRRASDKGDLAVTRKDRARSLSGLSWSVRTDRDIEPSLHR